MDCEKIFREAREAAVSAANAEQAKWGGDFGSCGFAWVNINPARGPFITWLKKKALTAGDGLEGKERVDALNEARHVYGSRGWDKGWQFWNPARSPVQNIDIKEAGAKAFCDVLKNYGISASWGSRLD